MDPTFRSVSMGQSGARSLDQNARLWAMLGDLAEQVDWHGQKLSDTEWKDVMTAALKRQKVVPGIDGGFVVLGTSTRRMTKPEMTELMELMAAFGAQHDVTFRDERYGSAEAREQRTARTATETQG